MNLEDDLRAALRREPAPQDLAHAILAKTQRHTTVRTLALPLAAAIGALALLPAAWQYRQHEQALAAKDQLIEALSVTRTQLEHTQEKIHSNTRHTR